MQELFTFYQNKVTFSVGVREQSPRSRTLFVFFATNKGSRKFVFLELHKSVYNCHFCVELHTKTRDEHVCVDVWLSAHMSFT